MSTLSTPIIDAPTLQQRERGPSTRRTAVFVGLLFLTATAAFIFAEAITSRVLSQPNFLAEASSQTTLATAALLLFGAVRGGGHRRSPVPAAETPRRGVGPGPRRLPGHRTCREPVLSGGSPAGDRARRRTADGTVDGSASSSLGALLQAQHSVAILMIYIATGAAGICMATLLYRSRLIPRWLAILGLVTYPTLLAGTILDMFNVVDVTQGIGLVAFVPGALFEFILPVWLIVKGFSVPDHD